VDREEHSESSHLPIHINITSHRESCIKGLTCASRPVGMGMRKRMTRPTPIEIAAAFNLAPYDKEKGDW
jgi:hypothetical protein